MQNDGKTGDKSILLLVSHILMYTMHQAIICLVLHSGMITLWVIFKTNLLDLTSTHLQVFVTSHLLVHSNTLASCFLSRLTNKVWHAPYVPLQLMPPTLSRQFTYSLLGYVGDVGLPSKGIIL
jgi:hypothetical protein